MKKKSSGISIIEITIVMIVLGLISVSVLTGTALIEQAKLRAINNELTGYQEAYYIFKLSYECLPGDCDAIASLLPHDQNCGAVVTGALTPGNGDSMLVEPKERRYFWCHLALSGTDIPKLTYGDTADFQAGIHIPETKALEGGYAPGYFTGAGKNGTTVGPLNSNALVLFRISGPGVDFMDTSNKVIANTALGSLTPLQAKSLLRKYDVIEPHKGSYRIENNKDTDTCYVKASGQYTNNKGTECVLIYKLDQDE